MVYRRQYSILTDVVDVDRALVESEVWRGVVSSSIFRDKTGGDLDHRGEDGVVLLDSSLFIILCSRKSDIICSGRDGWD